MMAMMMAVMTMISSHDSEGYNDEGKMVMALVKDKEESQADHGSGVEGADQSLE